jgi:hypothetical protein
MDVYLIPTATAGRYELYYEAPDDPPTETGESGGGLLDRLTFGWFSRVQHRFDDMLLEAEEWRHRRHEAQPEPAGVLAKARRKVMGYIVERIAEQRLLWHLRKQERVCARIPSDISESDADAVIRGMVKKDADHHLKWLWVDPGTQRSRLLLHVSGRESLPVVARSETRARTRTVGVQDLR